MSLLYRMLDTVGDGSGAINFNGDYSGVQGKAILAPPVGKVYSIVNLMISIEDTTGFTASKYGNLSALINGITMRAENDIGVILDVTNGNPIKTNAQWASVTYDTDLKSWGAGNEVLVARFSAPHPHEELELNGDSGDKLVFTFDDNLTGLILHTFMAQGSIR